MRLLAVGKDGTELLPLGLDNERGYLRRDLPRAVWSGSAAFTYTKTIGSRREFILRRGDSEVVLSRHWPHSILPQPSRN